jgi:acetate kinase
MQRILTINGGSSSLRYALFDIQDRPVRVLDGKLERLTGDSSRAVDTMMEKLGADPAYVTPDAIGHRIVHGMQHSAPERITPRLLTELRKFVPYDPEHLPREIALIRAMQQQFKKVPQVACFDTAFHRSMPRVATLLPIPRRYLARGVQRYGFHGLSFTFLLQELRRLGDIGASWKRREPCCGAKWPLHRYQHGLHADGRTGHGHALRRFGSRLAELFADA